MSLSSLKVFNVSRFGAIGDGSTDDTAALNRAVTAAAVAGGVIYFTSGKTYKTVGGIAISGNNIRLVGNGAKLIGPSESDFVRISITGKTDIQIEGLIFDSTYSSATSAVNNGQIDVTGTCARIVINNCIFQNTSNCGIRLLGNASNIRITNCRFTTYGTAIFFNTDSTYQPVNCTITNCYLGTPISGTTGGITMHGVSGAPYGGHVISNNTLEASVTTGIELQTRVDSCTVSGNLIRGAGYAISVAGSNNIAVTGNTILNPTVHGIEVAGAKNVSVTGNSIDGRTAAGILSSGDGIAVFSNSTDTTITGNSITGFDGYQVNLQTHIRTNITGNTITMQTGTSSSSGFCINSKDYIDMIINSNMLVAIGGATFIFMDSTDAAGDGVVITNNLFTGAAPICIIGFYGNNNHQDTIITNNNTANASGAAGAISFGVGANIRTICDNNIGDGTQSLTTNLNIPVVSTSTSTTIDFRYSCVLVDATAGTKTITLPTAASNAGKEYHIAKVDSSGNAVTVATTSSQTINGSTTQSLASQYKRITVKSDGTNWTILQSN